MIFVQERLNVGRWGSFGVSIILGLTRAGEGFSSDTIRGRKLGAEACVIDGRGGSNTQKTWENSVLAGLGRNISVLEGV